MTKLTTFGRRHPTFVVVGLVLFVAALATFWFVSRQAQVEQATIYLGVPDAPKLTAGSSDQIVYRIDASRSQAQYEVEEQLAGTSHTATGVTKGIAGDVLIDNANPANSKVGDIVVNVEQLSSDQALRDARIRHDFLESSNYKLATYKTNSIEGLPASIEDGKEYQLTLKGDLTVKTTTAPVDLSVTAKRDGSELKLRASTTVKLSTFGVGPISLIGFVSAGDDAKLTFDLTAADSAKFAGELVAPAPETPDVQTGATATFTGSFDKDVKPVLEAKCASCHNSGEAGASIWTLDTAGDAKKVANGLGLAVESKYMPPWLPSDAGIPLQHSLKLSDTELKTVVDWAKSGGNLDVPESTPVKAAVEIVNHPRADAELKLAEPYQGSQEKPNDYRCFMLDPKLTQPTPMTGYEFVPDQTTVVHHSLVYRMKASAVPNIVQADADDPGPGWECFGGVGGRGSSLSPTGAAGGSELVAGWAPGQLPSVYPDGVALPLDPGDVFVIQMHYHYGHDNPPDQSKLVVQYGDKPVDQYDRLRVTTYLAPAEIPCEAGDNAPLCDRTAAMAELVKQYGPSAQYIADGLHLLCGTKPEDIAKLDNGVAKASCDHRIRGDQEIISVLGHEHQIGKTYRMTLNPGTPDEKILLDIPRWDFNWQMNYAPVETIKLKKGDVIRVECSWDRALINPASPHRWVLWSEGTEDEMCFSTIATRETKK